jgi:hypothetical protein
VTLDEEKMESLQAKFDAAKLRLGEQLDAGFEAGKAKLAEAHEAAKQDLAAKFETIAANFTSIKEVPIVLASKSEDWKGLARVQIEELSKNALPLDILKGDNEIFTIGE